VASYLIEPDNYEVLVLLSGGIDSTACLDFYKELGRRPFALFVDYGQLAARMEADAAKAITAYYSVPLISSTWQGYQTKHDGLIPGRNCFIISAALMERPNSVSLIALGVHAGTDYPDCSQPFLEAMRAVLELSENHSVQLATPFAAWTKQDIIAYCRIRDVPVHLTYSCERGTEPPCGACLSCKDRGLPPC
jgi:7-cyano-7-deazaguanine synthase